MQWIYRRTSTHMCGFHKFELQVWVFSCKFAAYLQDTFCYFVRKPLGDSLWIFFTLFSQLIFNFTCFVIQVKENLYAYNLASLTDENRYICRFDASFFVLRAVSTTRRLMKNSCCESFNIIFETQVMPFPASLLFKAKTLFEKLFNFFYICFPRTSEIHFWSF